MNSATVIHCCLGVSKAVISSCPINTPFLAYNQPNLPDKHRSSAYKKADELISVAYSSTFNVDRCIEFLPAVTVKLMDTSGVALQHLLAIAFSRSFP